MNNAIRCTAMLAVIMVGATNCSELSHADDWGCTVVLCLANPAGYGAISECLEPVRKMFDIIRSGGRPSCDGSGINLQISRGKKQSQRFIQYTNASGLVVTQPY